jgi:predicted nucleotidyltransferase
MLTESDIARISGRIADTYAPLAMGTFGSYAIGSAREKSDLDLFVIKRISQRPEATVRAVRRLLVGVFHPMDIRVFTAYEFEGTVYEYLSFTWVVARQARLYHWTEEAAFLVPSLLPRALGIDRNRKEFQIGASGICPIEM